MGGSVIRRAVLVVVLAVLMAAVSYDRLDQAPTPAEPAEAVELAMPAVTDPAVLSSAWYCPMGVAAGDQTVHVTNVGTEPVIGSIDVLTGDGPGPSLRFRVEAHDAEQFRLSSLIDATSAGSVIEITGGSAVVGHRIGTSLGMVEGPCATAAADTWHFAAGSTTRDSRQILALLNPSYDDVVFSATFETPTRTVTPGDLEAAVVPARSVRLIEVTDAVSREAVVSTRIETVRGGLAVERLQLSDGTLGPIGAALTLGVTDAATDWELPVGQVHAGGDAQVVVTNPTDLPAEVDLYLVPDDPADRGRYGLVPEELDIRAGGVVTVDVDELASRLGLPLPVDLGVRVVSANGTPVLAERWHLDPAIDETLIGAGGTNARLQGTRFQTDEGPEVDESDLEVTDPVELDQPTPDRGLLVSRGTTVTADRWLFPVVTLADTAVAITAPASDDGAPVEVSIRTITGGVRGTPTTVTVPAEGRMLVPITSTVSVVALEVTASGPVSAEVSLVETGVRSAAIAGVPVVPGGS